MCNFQYRKKVRGSAACQFCLEQVTDEMYRLRDEYGLKEIEERRILRTQFQKIADMYIQDKMERLTIFVNDLFSDITKYTDHPNYYDHK